MPESASTHPSSALPVGYEFSGFRIEKVLGQGGFGFTYLAYEKQLDRRVALKELFPRQYVTRINRVNVAPRSSADTTRFSQAKHRFVDEARKLARFHHDNIVRVQRLLEDHHGTAYFVMDFIQGTNFLQWLQIHRSPAESQLKPILLPLLDGLEYLHSNGIYHQDISPENILINQQGKPILIDFGSARDDKDGGGQEMPTVTRAGYSAFEQYVPGQKGPYTDLYALASVMIHAITGKAPPSSLDRKMNPAGFVAERYRGRYSPEFLHALERAFALMPADRPQNVREFRRLLTEPVKVASQKPAGPAFLRNPWALCAVAGALILLLLAFTMSGSPAPPAIQSVQAVQTVTTPVSPPVTEPPVVVPPPSPAPVSGPIQSPYTSGSRMQFVEMPFKSIDNKRIFFCIHQTRRRDYKYYCPNSPIYKNFYIPKFDAANDNGTAAPDESKYDDYPVANINQTDAAAFCDQMTAHEHLPDGARFRLPTKDEWGQAAHQGVSTYPWGDQWPPLTAAGTAAANLADKSFDRLVILSKDESHSSDPQLKEFWPYSPTDFIADNDYDDKYAGTAPVMSFPLRTKEGLYDLGSNVEEWCAERDGFDRSIVYSRGASWRDFDGSAIGAVTARINKHNSNAGGYEWVGFRVVLELPASP